MRMRMLKRGMALDEVVKVLILVVVLVVIIMVFITPNGRGLLQKAFKSFVPQSFLPDQKQDFEQIPLPEVPPSVDVVYKKIIETFKKGHQGPCIVEYNKGTADLKDWSIIFTNVDTATRIELTHKNIQVRKEFIAKQNVCVVGGEIYSSGIYLGGGTPVVNINGKGEVDIMHKMFFDDLSRAFDYDEDNINWAAKNFYTNWIAETDWAKHPAYRSIRNGKQRILAPDYTNPRSITIVGKDAMEINYGDEVRPFGKEDGGLLYVPESGKVCFFPTIGGGPLSDWSGDCEGHEQGLEQDCFDKPAEDKIFTVKKC